MKCPRLYLCLAHFYFISIHQLHPPSVDATNAPTQSWMIWSNPYHHMTLLIHRSSTLPTFLRCFGPSAPSLAQASPPRGPSLQSLNLPFSIATGPSSQALSWSSSLWSHDSMSCHICNMLLLISCGLTTCVYLHHTLLVHLMLSLNYQNQTRTFQSPPFL